MSLVLEREFGAHTVRLLSIVQSLLDCAPHTYRVALCANLLKVQADFPFLYIRCVS